MLRENSPEVECVLMHTECVCARSVMWVFWCVRRAWVSIQQWLVVAGQGGLRDIYKRLRSFFNENI